MAISRITSPNQYQLFDTNDDPYDASVNIPAGTDTIVFLATHYTNTTLTSVSLGGQTFTIDVNANNYGTGACVSIAHLHSPASTGEQTITVNWGAEMAYCTFTFVYYDGTDTTTVRDSDTDVGGDTPSITLTTQSGDWAILVAGGDDVQTWTNVTTEIVSDYNGSIMHNVAELTCDGTSETISVLTNYGAEAVAGVVLQAAGGGASSTPIFRRRLNILLRLCLSSFSTLFWRLLR